MRFFRLVIIIVFFTVCLQAKSSIDSVFHASDFVIEGSIKNIGYGFVHDLGTYEFMVDIQIDTIIKQNSHLNIPVQTITWEKSTSYPYRNEEELRNEIVKYEKGKWIFLLTNSHISGGGDKLPDVRILPLTPENHYNVLRLAENEKIPISLKPIPISCGKHCALCNKIEKGKMPAVKRRIKRKSRQYNRCGKSIGQLRYDLMKHRNINYILPMGDILASLPSYGSLRMSFNTEKGEQKYYAGYQLGYIHYLLHFIHFENVDYFRMKSFTPDTVQDKSFMDFEKELFYLRLHNTKECNQNVHFMEVPELYLAFSESFEKGIDHIYRGENNIFIRNSDRLFIDSLLKDSQVYTLCLMALHSNFDIGTGALKALKELNDPRSIPFLIELATFHSKKFVNGSEFATLHQIYCKNIIETLDHQLQCQTPIVFGSSLQQFRLGLMIDVWKSKIKVK